MWWSSIPQLVSVKHMWQLWCGTKMNGLAAVSGEMLHIKPSQIGILLSAAPEVS